MSPRKRTPALAQWAALALVLALASCRAARPSRLASVDETAAFEAHGYALVLRGNQSFSDAALERALEVALDDFAQNQMRRAFVDDAAYNLENFYRSRGFPFALVTYDLEVTVRGVWVYLNVDEGPRIRVERVDFDGLGRMGVDEAREFFLFPRLRAGEDPLYSEAALRAGISALTERYLARGHMDVAIDIQDSRIDEASKTARPLIRVHEGPRYRVQGILLEGLPQEQSAVLGPELEASLGADFTPRLAFELRNRVLEWLGERGYAEAEVQLERTIDPELGHVLLCYRVEQGPRIRIRAVNVEGNRKTLDRVIRSRVQQANGSIYRRERIRESFSRIYQTGIFGRVGLELVEPQGPVTFPLADGEAARDLEVKVEELPSQEIFLEPGYGSYEQLRLRLGYRERNLFGTGRAFRAEATGALRAQRGEIGLTDNQFLLERLRADFSVRANEREEPSFTRQELGFNASFSWPLARHVENTVAYQYKLTRVRDVEIVNQDVLTALEDVDISSILVSPRLDTRDDLFVPSRGGQVRAGVEWGDKSLGSELDFLRLTLAASRFFSLDREGENVLALSAEAGAIVPRGDSEVIPLQERYFLGGESNVRAFKESELGPLDTQGKPIGGEAFTLASAEYRRRLTDKLQGALFVDAGNVLLDYNDLGEFEDFRWGLGVGIRYVLPVGPLRLDLGWNPEPRAEEEDLVLHFALGMSF